MLTSAQLRSSVFDRLTGRLAPGRLHPTSTAFSLERWANRFDAEPRHRAAIGNT